MGGESSLTIVYGFVEPNAAYVSKVDRFGLHHYGLSNVMGDIVYGILSTKRRGESSRTTLSALQHQHDKKRNITEQKMMTLMDSFAKFRGASAEWMVVKAGGWNTDLFADNDFDYEMFSLEYKLPPGVERDENYDEDKAFEQWREYMKSQMQQFEDEYLSINLQS